MNRRKAFTLIELLVVIAIIALLLSILIPSLNIAKQMAAGAVCLHHMGGMSKAYYIYAGDNDSKVVIGTQGPGRWVEVPQDMNGNVTGHNSTLQEKYYGIMEGTLYPYVENVKAYHCVGDKRYIMDRAGGGKGPYRSISIPAGLNCPDNTNGWSHDTGISIGSYQFYPIRKHTDFITPGDTYIFVEENYTHAPGVPASSQLDRGYNSGPWSFWNDGYDSWWDPLAPWHNDKTNLAYADGHSEKLVWKDERTVKFAHDRQSVPYKQPGNPDQEYMSRAYPCKR